MPCVLGLTPLILLTLQVTLANIIFHWNQPVCKPSVSGWTGCLRGQDCLSDRTCRSTLLHTHDDRSPTARDFSTDGRCGPNNDNLLCDPDSKMYFGTCCSQYGWCGDGDAYCGEGCLANCSESGTKFVSAFLTTSQSTSRTAIGEPTLDQPTTTSSGATVTSTLGDVTVDGTCGVHFGGTVCGDWYKGSCCSMYGWCGNTTAHCGDGCQSGPCLNGSSAAAPGPSPAPKNANPGSFTVVGQSGVPVMHAALMENGRVIFLDKVEDYTQLKLPNGQYAYSAEYDPATNRAVPLSYQTNAFCSGGTFLADGRLLNIGGNAPLTAVDPTIGDGFTALRYLTRSSTNTTLDGQSWSEPGNKLNSARWYASAQTLPDGTVFVASGSLNGLNPSITTNNNPTFEILDAQGISTGPSTTLDILETNQPFYMYPFIHLLRDTTLFLFVSKSAEIYNTTSQTTVKKLPDLPGDYRTYPNTGGSVLLPLSSTNGYAPDILVCGGGVYQDISSPTDASCGRIQLLSDSPEWEMDSMPEGRTMVEGTLLPDGTVLWLNGCSQGAQGFGLGADPAYEALIYDPSMPLGSRFVTDATSTIARLYHSIALLLLDGTVLVAGSNPVEQPILTPDAADPYVTEFRVEIYTPPYLSNGNAQKRPTSISLSDTSLSVTSTNTFTVSFSAPAAAENCSVVLYQGGFVTHSLHMGQRMVVLDMDGFVGGELGQVVTVSMPSSKGVLPPGPYMLFVVVDGVPGIGTFVKVS